MNAPQTLDTLKSVGRTLGLLLIAQGVGGALVSFFLLGPVITTPPGFLENAAGQPFRIGVAALIGIASGALSVAIAVTAWPVVREHSRAAALWLLSLGAVGLSLAVAENSAVMSLLSVSQAFARADAADESLFQAMRVIVASARNWLHYTHLLLGGGMFLVFYGALYRFALIPRTLAACGVAAVALQMIGVAMPLVGYRITMLMLTPMGVAHLAIAVWLAVKGFEITTTPRVQAAQTGLSRGV